MKDDVIVGTVAMFRQDVAKITIVMWGFSDIVPVTPKTPGFNLLAEVGEKGRVVVRVEPFWPQYEFSSRPYFVVTEILQGVADL